MENPHLAVEEIYRVCKENFIVIFSVPILNLGKKWAPILRKIIGYDTLLGEHLHLFSAKDFMKLIEGNFSVVDRFIVLLKKRFGIGDSLESLLIKLSRRFAFLRYFASGIIVKAKKQPDKIYLWLGKSEMKLHKVYEDKRYYLFCYDVYQKKTIFISVRFERDPKALIFLQQTRL